MSNLSYAKCACESCGLHIEFPLDAAGHQVACPGCGKETKLGALAITSQVPPAETNAPSFTFGELIGAFTGPIPRTSPSFFYQVGLLFVTLMTLLLPVLYVAMIGAVAWAVYCWATEFTFLLTATPGGVRFLLLKVAIYGAPLFAGAVLVLFMIKPLFARRAPRSQPLALNPGAEPLLFAFIEKVCETIGAPSPKRIDLDCELNASASFRRGAWSLLSSDLVLTIGLPLVAALNLREFAGILAHEFGHFTQGFGMRLSYVIRNINAWFARVIYERDAPNAWLEELSEAEASSITIIVACAQLAVWFSRQLLELLMLLGHGVGCFMRRQMEYDADRYEIKLVGSAVFENTTRRMHVLALVLQSAYKNLRPALKINRTLPENFPAYLLRTESALRPRDGRRWRTRWDWQPPGFSIRTLFKGIASGAHARQPSRGVSPRWTSRRAVYQF